MTDSVDLIFRGSPSEVASLRDLLDGDSLNYQETKAAGSLGGGELIALLVPVAAATVPAVAHIVATWIKSRPTVSVEMKGLKVSGTAKDVESILNRHLPKTSSKGKGSAG